MDRFKAMAVLTAAVDAGSLSAAGRRLNMPLATVSRIVSELESHLAARLLNRTTRRLALTEAGAAYVAAARRILEQVEESERAAGGEYAAPRGDLIVTAPIVFGRLHVLPIIGHFLRDYPQIDVRLLLSDRNLDLMEDHVDIAFRIGALPDSALVAMRLGSVRHVTCASPAYLKARGVPKTPADLAGHDGIGFASLGAGPWQFQSTTVMVRQRLVVSTAEAAIDAAVAGLGITRLLSYQIEQALEAKRLRILLAGHEPEPLPVHMLHGAKAPLPLKLRAFLDFAAPRLRARLARQGSIAQ
jgi:DNA-binding transcriptional LysR family regulator